MKTLSLVLCMLLLAAPSLGQVVIVKPGGQLVWDHAVDPATYTHQVLVDSGAPVTVKATCTPSAAPTVPVVWTCKTPLPALTAGSHTVRVTATVTVSGQTYTSDPSETLTLVNVVIDIPKNPRIEAGGE